MIPPRRHGWRARSPIRATCMAPTPSRAGRGTRPHHQRLRPERRSAGLGERSAPRCFALSSPTLPGQVLTDNRSYYELSVAYQNLAGMYAQAVAPVVKYLGGQYINRDHVGDPGGRPPFENIPIAKQREALAFILEGVFSRGRAGAAARGAAEVRVEPVVPLGIEHHLEWPGRLPVPRAGARASSPRCWTSCSSRSGWRRIRDGETKFGAAEVVTIPELMNGVTRAVWAESWGPALRNTPAMRRDLQRAHLDRPDRAGGAAGATYAGGCAVGCPDAAPGAGAEGRAGRGGRTRARCVHAGAPGGKPRPDPEGAHGKPGGGAVARSRGLTSSGGATEKPHVKQCFAAGGSGEPPQRSRREAQLSQGGTIEWWWCRHACQRGSCCRRSSAYSGRCRKAASNGSFRNQGRQGNPLSQARLSQVAATDQRPI